jgi:hypothetical protein
MAYTDLIYLKSYLNVTGDTDDAILNECISRATAILDAQFSHRFEATTATRYYNADDLDGTRVLYLDAPLLTVTTLTNGDGTVITSADYWLLPRNEAPYWRIQLKANGTVTYFEFDDQDDEISIVGTWGYMATANAMVQQATTRLAAYVYRQRDSQVFETTAMPELGILTIPAGIPNDVKIMIETLQARYSLG